MLISRISTSTANEQQQDKHPQSLNSSQESMIMRRAIRLAVLPVHPRRTALHALSSITWPIGSGHLHFFPLRWPPASAENKATCATPTTTSVTFQILKHQTR
eukprot:4328285-Amphidinium_carterae.3